MRLPIHSWNNTLAKLGFRKVKRKRSAEKARREQRLMYEALEPRQLLASDLLAATVSVAQKTELREYVADMMGTYATGGYDAVKVEHLQGAPNHTAAEFAEYAQKFANGYSDDQWAAFREAYRNGQYSPLDDLLVFAYSTVSDQSAYLDNVSADVLSGMDFYALRSMYETEPTVELPGEESTYDPSAFLAAISGEEESSGFFPSLGGALDYGSTPPVYDVDGDGVMDIDDFTDIETAVYAASPYDALRDVDEDGDVDADDLDQWFTSWEAHAGQSAVQGDIDLDGDVDLDDDYLVIFDNFTGPTGVDQLWKDGDVHQDTTPWHPYADGDIDHQDIQLAGTNYTGVLTPLDDIEVAGITLADDALDQPSSIDLSSYVSSEALGGTVTYSFANSNPWLVTPTLDGDQLDLAWAEGVAGSSVIAVTAEDQWGNTLAVNIDVSTTLEDSGMLESEFSLAANWRLTEDSGDAVDWSGNGYDLTEVGTVETVDNLSGKQGGAREFDGRDTTPDGHFELAPVIGGGAVSPFSLAASGYTVFGWFKDDSTSANWLTNYNNDSIRVLAGKTTTNDLSATGDEWLLAGEGDAVKFSVVDSGGTVRTVTHSFDNASAPFDVNDTYYDEDWHFVAAGFDPDYEDATLGGSGGSSWIQVDGGTRLYFATESGSYITAPTSTTSSKFTIGARGGSATNRGDTMWAGQLDEWGIFAGSLSGDQYDYLHDMQTVNSTDDDNTSNTAAGEVTLRSAIEDANAATGMTEIRFDIPLDDSGYDTVTKTVTIEPGSANALPDITETVVIAGFSQPDYAYYDLTMGGDADLPNLIYDPVSGDVILDPAGLANDEVGYYEIKSTGDDLIGANHSPVWFGLSSTDSKIEDTRIALPAKSGFQNLGNVLAADLDQAGMEAAITSARATAATGSAEDFELFAAAGFIGASTSQLVQIKGTTAGGSIDGLTLADDEIVVRGLAIHDFGGDGIEIDAGDSNVIQANLLGTDPAGTDTIGNAGAGIYVNGGSDNLIGGVHNSQQNSIAYNTGDGVDVGSGTDNAILENEYLQNSGLPVDLGSNGATTNDTDDVDTGANDLQNFPVLTAAYSQWDRLWVEGTLNSTANTVFRIDLFYTDASNVTTSDVGPAWANSFEITTDAGGDATFDVMLLGGVTAGQYLSATATQIHVDGSYGSSSEFSATTRIELEGVTVIDNGDSDFDSFGESGSWSTLSSQPLSYGSDYMVTDYDSNREEMPDDGFSSATWTFDNLADGTYDVYVSYHVDATYGVKKAPYIVYSEAPNSDGFYAIDSQLTSVIEVNQSTAVTADVVGPDYDWERLERVTIDSGVISVQLATGGTAASKKAYADAVMIQPIETLTATFPDITVHVNPNFAREKVVSLSAAFAEVADFDSTTAEYTLLNPADLDTDFEVHVVNQETDSLILVPRLSADGEEPSISVHAIDGNNMEVTGTFVAKITSNLIQNGSFERTPAAVDPNDWALFGQIEGWQRKYSEGKAQIEVSTGGGWGHDPYHGNNFVELDAHPGEGSTNPYSQVEIYQIVDNMIPDQKYELSFAFAARSAWGKEHNKLGININDYLNGMNDISFETKGATKGANVENNQPWAEDYLWDADVLPAHNNGDRDVTTEWERYTVTFTAGSEKTWISFYDASGSAYANLHGSFLDDVRLIAIQDTLLVDGCVPCEDTLKEESVASMGSGSTQSSIGPSGVRPVDGAFGVTSNALSSFAAGLPFGQSVTLTNLESQSSGILGHSAAMSQLPSLQLTNGGDIRANNGTSAMMYEALGGEVSGSDVTRYEASALRQSSLKHDTSDQEYTETDTAGNVIVYHDFTVTNEASRGMPKKYVDNARNETDFTYYTAGANAGKLEEVTRTTVDGIVETYKYSYISAGSDNEGLLTKVELERDLDGANNGDPAVKIREVNYSYYGHQEQNVGGNAGEIIGNLGDLKKIEVKEGSDVIDTSYYRYYNYGETNGHGHGLKYVFNSASYERVVAEGLTPETATNAELADFADNYFEYDQVRRVTKTATQGSGCSSCAGGLGSFEYEYETSNHANGYNSWRYKTIEKLPDGNQNITFANSYGQTMLTVFVEDPDGNPEYWYNFTKYDSEGRVVLEAGPSAVSGYSEASPDLLVEDPDTGFYTHLNDSSGLITTTTYYGSAATPVVTPVYRFDFGTATSPVESGYERVTHTDTRWTGTVTSEEEGVIDELRSDYVVSTIAGDISFAVDVPDGFYDVVVTFGDADSALDASGVMIEGALKDSGVTTTAGEYYTETFTGIQVLDSTLNLTRDHESGSAPSSVRLNALEIFASAGTDTKGPQVVSTSIEEGADLVGSVDRIRVVFNEPIRTTYDYDTKVSESTFTADDIAVFDRGSADITSDIVEVVQIDAWTFDIVFAAQTTLETYTLTLGPNIEDRSGGQDYAGNLMNQDGDTSNGEATQDQFTLTFDIVEVGGALGYYHATYVQMGDTDLSPIKQHEVDYVAAIDEVTGNTIYKTKNSTVYSDTDGLVPQTTTYAYGFREVATKDSTEVEWMTVTLPVVSTGQNGPGGSTGAESTTYFDIYGRPTWTRDAENFLTYTEYDDATGAVTKQIVDVDTVNGTADFTGLPDIPGTSTPVSTPIGGGKHLVTTYEVDELGRTTKMTAPTGEITYTWYDDANDETRIYRNWDSTNHKPREAVEVYRHDEANNYTESLTFTWIGSGDFPRNLITNEPNGGADLTESTEVQIESLSRSVMNSAGQQTAELSYFSFDSITYQQDVVELGAQGTNFLKTEYNYYDARGRLSVTTQEDGVIEHVFYDGLGRITETWIGTDDIPDTDHNTSGEIDFLDFRSYVLANGSAPNDVNMQKVSENIYDAGGVGDGYLTESRSYHDGTNYYSSYSDYDFRGRMTASLGPNGVATEYAYDNLSRAETIKTFGAATYNGLSKEIETDPADQQTEQEMKYDDRGQLYESITHDTASTDTLVTKYYHDIKGRQIKTEAPDGMIQKTAYNSLGQIELSYTVADEGNNTSPDNVTDDEFISVTKNIYDDFGRPIEVWMGMSDSLSSSDAISKTYYDSDHDGNNSDDEFRVTGRESLKPGSDSIFVLTQYEYDTVGRLDEVIYPDAGYNGSIEAAKTVSTFDMLGRTLTTQMEGVTSGDLFSKSSTTYDSQGRVDTQVQHEVDAGATTSNSLTTTYNYDWLGRVESVVPEIGPYSFTTYDLLGRVVSRENRDETGTLLDVATNVYDTTTGQLKEIKEGTTALNQVITTKYYYDGTQNGSGDELGRLTAMEVLTATAGASTFIKTTFDYDGYGRQYKVTEAAPDGSLSGRYVVQTYDSKGRPTVSEAFLSGSNQLISKTEDKYGHHGDLFLVETIEYEVDPTTGNLVGTSPYNHLSTTYDYGDFGRLIKTTDPYGAFTKTAYSLGGNVIATYLGTDEGNNTDADVLTNDTIVEQVEYEYDNLGNQILVTSFQRYDDDAAEGEEFTTSSTDARVSYAAWWYDAAGLLIDEVNYGVAGSSFTRPDSAPASSATELRTSYGYDGYLRHVSTTDPAGSTTLSVLDEIGRTTHVIQNYKSNGGANYWYETVPGVEDYDRPYARTTGAKDWNYITKFVYDDAGRLTERITLDPAGDNNESGNTDDNQITRYIYSGELLEANDGTPVPRSSLVRAEVYGDAAASLSRTNVKDLLNGIGTGHDFVEYTYFADGSVETMVDQREVEHTYAYDKWGRVISDTVTGTVPSTVDSSVLRIDTSYTEWGQVFQITSYSDTAGTTEVNQIEYKYDGWGNVTDVWQEHDGEVDNDGAPDSALVQYGYDALARNTSITYPTTRTVDYSYGAANSMDDRLSRVYEIIDNVSSDVLSRYTYVGAGLLVESERPEVGVDTEDYLKLSYGDSSNDYAGLDRFSRVVDQDWTFYDHSGPTTSHVDQYTYGYDRLGNRTWKENVNAAGQTVDLDEYYTYDATYRLTNVDRGDLNVGKTAVDTPDFEQDWTLDGLGNWDSFTDDGATAVTRTFNEANEVVTSSASVKAEYDAAGNMTKGPQPGDNTVRQHYVYDAWNRLVEVLNDDSVSPGTPDESLVEYEYDGLNRRIEKRITAAGGGVANIDYYFNESWQLIEEAIANGSDVLQKMNHYVWDIAYIDAPVMRYQDGDGDGNWSGGSDSEQYFTYDANWNVTGAIDEDGTVLARYGYDPYGMATEYAADWTGGTAPTEDGPLYAGYFFDAETGLYHVRNRQYQADTGKFLQRDPIGYAAGDSNLTRYVGSSPLSATDPLGLEESVGARIAGFGASAAVPSAVTNERYLAEIVNGDLSKLGSDLKPNEAYVVYTQLRLTEFIVRFNMKLGKPEEFDNQDKAFDIIVDQAKDNIVDKVKEWASEIAEELVDAVSKKDDFYSKLNAIHKEHIASVQVLGKFHVDYAYVICENGKYTTKFGTREIVPPQYTREYTEIARASNKIGGGNTSQGWSVITIKEDRESIIPDLADLIQRGANSVRSGKLVNTLGSATVGIIKNKTGIEGNIKSREQIKDKRLNDGINLQYDPKGLWKWPKF